MQRSDEREWKRKEVRRSKRKQEHKDKSNINIYIYIYMEQNPYLQRSENEN